MIDKCSCGATCSQVEALEAQVRKLQADIEFRVEEVAYLRGRLGVDEYGNQCAS